MNNETKHQPQRFFQLLEERFSQITRRYLQKDLTPDLMREIRTAFQNTVKNVFSQSKKTKLSENAVVWLADQYFKGIHLTDDMLMSDQVVINEYALDELEFNDIEVLNSLFNETSMAPDLLEEFVRRKKMLS